MVVNPSFSFHKTNGVFVSRLPDPSPTKESALDLPPLIKHILSARTLSTSFTMDFSRLGFRLQHHDRELAYLEEQVAEPQGYIIGVESRIVETSNPSQHNSIPASPDIDTPHQMPSRGTTRSIGRSVSEGDLRQLRARYVDKFGLDIVQTSDAFLTCKASAPASANSTESENTYTACAGDDQSMKATGCLPYSTPGLSRRILIFPLLEDPVDILRSLYLDQGISEVESSKDDSYASAGSFVSWDYRLAYDVLEPTTSGIYDIEEYIDRRFLMNLVISCVLIASAQPLWPVRRTSIPGRPSWDDTDSDWAGAPVREDILARFWRNSRLLELPSMVRAMIWKEIPVTFKEFDCSNTEKVALSRICRDAASKWRCRIRSTEIRSVIHDTTDMGSKRDRHGSHITADFHCLCETHRSSTTVHIYVDKELRPTGIWKFIPWCHGLKEPVPSFYQRGFDYPYHLVQHRFTRTHADLDVEEAPERAIIQAQIRRQILADEEFMRERDVRQQQLEAERSLGG